MSHRAAVLCGTEAEVPILRRMFEKRMRGYRAMGYVREEPLEARIVSSPVRTVEYDGDRVALGSEAEEEGFGAIEADV